MSLHLKFRDCNRRIQKLKQKNKHKQMYCLQNKNSQKKQQLFMNQIQILYRLKLLNIEILVFSCKNKFMYYKLIMKNKFKYYKKVFNQKMEKQHHYNLISNKKKIKSQNYMNHCKLILKPRKIKSQNYMTVSMNKEELMMILNLKQVHYKIIMIS